MLSGIVAAIRDWASGLGGAGLFILAALDSSFLSFPQVNDLLVIFLSTKNPERMPYYAFMTLTGSLVGCFVLYGFARRGGEVFLRKRFSAPKVERGLALYQRHGLLAVVIPSLLPPPTPFKLFVLLAGAAKVSPWKFGAAIAIGRGIRYFGQGYLAVLYGERAATLVQEHGRAVGLGLAAAALAVGLTYYFVRKRRAGASNSPGRTDDSPSIRAGN
jgi:membrane protein YqaA with SNARE-associated domain